jgi:ABC-type branched-subunit amino acid transport system ATPase component/ABC-type branched-subunit amino acid transport system permease subunit
VSSGILTARRSNILLVLAACLLMPTLIGGSLGQATGLAMPLLFHSANALILSEAAAIALAALALNLLTGYAGQISLGQAGLLGAGAFACGLVTGRLGLPFWVGVPAGAAAAGVIALVIGIPALRLRGMYLAMVTIAFGYLMYSSVLRLDWFTGGSAGVILAPRLWTTHQLVDSADWLTVPLICLLLAWIIDQNVTRSRLGRAFRAIRENEAVAQAFGVDVARYKLLAFIISGALTGAAGALYGTAIGFVNSETFPFTLSLTLVIMVVVGGLGSRTGAAISAVLFFVFGYFLEGLPFTWLRGLEGPIGAALLMYTVARHPGGFASVIAELREGRRHKRTAAEEAEPPMPALPNLPRPEGLSRSESADTGAPVLDVKGISVRFGGLLAVDGASLNVPRGKIVGLIGPNGAGKTTLFNAISGLLRPTAGQVLLNGRDVSELPAHRRAQLGIARTFQQIGLARDQSVLENMLLAQHLLAGYDPGRALLRTPDVARRERELEARARDAIAALGFAGREDVPVKRLSHGQQRILEVGATLLTDPELLMLDEPSAGMSPAAAENLAERLRDLRDVLGRTVLLIEHHVPLVLDVCDYVYVLNFGQILAQGSPDEILAHPDVVGAYLGESEKVAV